MTSTEIQLSETCRLTGANWAAWLTRPNEWEFLAVCKLTEKQRAAAMKYLGQNALAGWLNETLVSKRSRSRALPQTAGLPGGRLFVFPHQAAQGVILVGAQELSRQAQDFWRVVAMSNPAVPALNLLPAADLDDVELESPYHLPEALDHILGLILKVVGCESGWLAVRSGDYFEIKAHTQCEDCSGARLQLQAVPLLQEIVKKGQARLIEIDDASWAMVPRIGFTPTARTWGALPLLMGQRLIGLIIVWLESPVPAGEWEKAQRLARKMAPSVEASVVFSDLANHLQRMSLLNDFAVTIASALDPEQIAQRMFAFLRHAFGTERINLTVMLADGNSVQNYSDSGGTIVLQTMASEDLDIPWLVEAGGVYRSDTITPESGYVASYPGSRSALMIPMKYQRQLIGILGLESAKEGAFSADDEHLLAIIASHLAGLLENGRLRSEAESRARNLSLIHEVVEQVIGLTDVREIAQISAELMARNFAYELTVISLFDEVEDKLVVAGMGGNAVELVQPELRRLDDGRKDGIMMRVAVTGENIVINDVSQNPFYLPLPNWDAGSEMCVALKDGDHVLGVINVESQRKNAFSQNDLIVLESLGGILSSVIFSAEQYRKLQMTVDQLRAAREELQERVAAQRVAETRLVQAAKLAAVGEMAAGVAHELNNPLTTVLGFTELVLDDLPEESDARGNMELVLREAQRARDVVRRLLDFARQSESVRARSDVNEIVTDILALVNHLLRTGGVQLSTELAEGLPWVSVDRSQIKQVLLNLVHNALHAMPTGGKLQIATALRRREQNDWLAISLKDTGTGIAPENLERVFEPFFTTRSKDGGTGLGLSVSYGIVADHGGFIDVESKVGKGSVFTVWLPVEVG